MAEIVVNFVVNKLCDVVFEEIFFLCGVKDKVERVKRELIRIQCFLRDANRKQGGDERVRNWVNELRNMSHWIEDTVELFVLEVIGESSGKYPDNEKLGVMTKLERVLKKTKKPVVIHKFGKEIDKILAQINEIAESRVKYGITNLGENEGTEVTIPFKRRILPGLDDTKLVGVGAEKDEIIEQLLDAKRLRRSVVSIVGPGGLGKSTVAEKTYSSDKIKGQFDVCIWVSISKNFTLINLLKKILQGLNNEKDGDEEYLLIEVNKLLREKKYLIVMDDVWSENLWLQISPALSDVKNGSRVLITSRFSNVPKAADPASTPYELRLLSEEESLELLFQTVIPNQEVTNQDFPSDLLDMAKQLAHKCDGLPLALVTMGGLLSVKPLIYHAWEKVLKTMVWSVDGQNCMDILASSYDDMSVDLKTCFIYLACFPEDQKIDAEDLIRLWVAEGLIPPISSRTLEDTAENYLEQLVQRSMVQVFERFPCGAIKVCGLHDLIRDLAIKKSEEENFLTVHSNENAKQNYGRARRVAIDHSGCEVMKYASSNLRSFLWFKGQFQDFSGQKLLKVLRCPTGPKGDFNKHLLEGLTQLKYLSLSGHFYFEENFKKSICRLKFLQTLDLQGVTYYGELPDCMWHFTTLRHVLLRDNLGPPPSADMKDLQTLSGVKIPASWETTALPNIPNLRTLKIEIGITLSWEVIVAFLHTLKNLVNLTIQGYDIPTKIVDMQAFPFYQHLKYLLLRDRLYDYSRQIPQPDATLFPTHLTDLSLDLCVIRQDLAILEKLQGLRKLELFFRHRNETVRCSAGGFPQLQVFQIYSAQLLMNWEIEEGAMPVLKKLHIESKHMFQVPQGLQHLTSLRELNWYYNGYDEAVPAKAQQFCDICKHVPSIVIMRSR